MNKSNRHEFSNYHGRRKWGIGVKKEGDKRERRKKKKNQHSAENTGEDRCMNGSIQLLTVVLKVICDSARLNK